MLIKVTSALCIAAMLFQNQPQLPIQPAEDGLMQVGHTYIAAAEELNEVSVERYAEKLNTMRQKYFPDSDVYYAIVPDKTYFARDRIGTYLNHDAMVQQLSNQMDGWQEIRIDDLLTLSDFYDTDPHWRQENLIPVAERICNTMIVPIDKNTFTKQSADGFLGAYRRLRPHLEPETVCWLTSDVIDSAKINDFQHPEVKTIYLPEKLQTQTPYDLFLAGATPLTVIENTSAETERELVLFRDSFGSSIAPLLLEGYKKITLVDLRYMASIALPQYVDFTHADVLFLHSAQIINNSILLR